MDSAERGKRLHDISLWVMGTASGIAALNWFAARQAPTQRIPLWPAYVLIGVAIAALAVALIPVVRREPRPVKHPKRGAALDPKEFREREAERKAQAYPPDPVHTFEIMRALWQALSRKRDVTEVVRALVVSGSVDFYAVNQVLTPGEDIEPGEGKVLFISYKVDGEQINRNFPESTHVVLPWPKR